MKWMVVATAPDQLTAEMWVGLLTGASIPARMRAGDVSSFLGVSNRPCRVLVPDDRTADAVACLSHYLTPDPSSQDTEADEGD